jgi:cytochrome P450
MCEPVVRAEAASSGSGMSEAEVATQIRTLLVAGYETTSGTHWSLLA